MKMAPPTIIKTKSIIKYNSFDIYEVLFFVITNSMVLYSIKSKADESHVLECHRLSSVTALILCLCTRLTPWDAYLSAQVMALFHSCALFEFDFQLQGSSRALPPDTGGINLHTFMSDFTVD